jgi:hypothetical protein
MELNTPFKGTYAPTDSDLTETPAVSVMLEFRKDVLNDPTRAVSIKSALLQLTDALNEQCKTRAYSYVDEPATVQNENRTEDSTLLQKIAETIGSDLTSYIENGALHTTLPEVGIAISAALSTHVEQLQEALDVADELTKCLWRWAKRQLIFATILKVYVFTSRTWDAARKQHSSLW